MRPRRRTFLIEGVTIECERDTLEAKVRLAKLTSRRRLYEPPRWFYAARPVLVVLALLGCALAMAGLLSPAMYVAAFLILPLAIRSPNRSWSWLCRWTAPAAEQALPTARKVGSTTQIAIHGTLAEMRDLLNGDCSRFETLAARTSQQGIHEADRHGRMDTGHWLAVGAVGVLGLAWLLFSRDFTLFVACGMAGAIVEYIVRSLPGPYVRIEHGNLELVRGRWFAEGWRVQDRVVIAGSQLTVDFEHALLTIRHGEEQRTVDLWAVEYPLQFVRRACVEAVMTPTQVQSEQGQNVERSPDRPANE
jgi:hypothetical protein